MKKKDNREEMSRVDINELAEPVTKPDTADLSDDEYDYEYKPPKKSRTLRIFGVTLSVIVIAAILGFIIYMLAVYKPFSDFAPKYTPKTTQGATAAQSNDNSSIIANNNTAARGTALVPYVVGLKANDAYKSLNQSGVKYIITREYSEDVEANCVIAQSAAGGTEIPANDIITITVSKGVDAPTDANPPTTYGATSPTDAVSSTNGKSNSYVLPDSDKRFITRADLEGMNQRRMEIALNEIYARHGRIFKTNFLKEHFESQSWYHGTISGADFDDNVLSYIERANITFISSVMEEKGYR